jgi:predicted component of type VI protein secretion system
MCYYWERAMPLRLCVTSANRSTLGPEQELNLAAVGGTIGRNADNDWVLPDQKCYVSGQHAMIDFQGGTYYLVDMSRNGVFVNDSDAPVGRGHPQRLFDGDMLRIGEYDIQVSVTEEPENALDDGMRDSVVRAQLVDEDESMELSLVDEGQLVEEDAALARHLTGSSDSVAARKDEQPAVDLSERIAAEDILTARNPGSAAEREAVAILLQAAGIKPTEIAGNSPQDILQTTGFLLRGLVGGLMELMNERTHLKDEFRLSQTMIQSGDNNPLKFSPSVTDALHYLLGNSSDSYLPAKDAVAASFREIEHHEKAVPRAMQQALIDFMERFDPDELRTRFDQGLKRNPLLAGTNRLKYWQLYEESYHTLTHGVEGKMPEAFSDEFARAYEREVEILRSARNKVA